MLVTSALFFSVSGFEALSKPLKADYGPHAYLASRNLEKAQKPAVSPLHKP